MAALSYDNAAILESVSCLNSTLLLFPSIPPFLIDHVIWLISASHSFQYGSCLRVYVVSNDQRCTAAFLCLFLSAKRELP